MPGPPLRQCHKHERQYTPSTHSVIPTRRIWNDDYYDQMIFGDLGGLKFPDICLTGEEKPKKKTSPKKPVPTGDRNRARRLTSAHATTCSTAVDRSLIFKTNIEKFRPRLFSDVGVVVSVSGCHIRGPKFDSKLYSRNFLGI